MKTQQTKNAAQWDNDGPKGTGKDKNTAMEKKFKCIADRGGKTKAEDEIDDNGVSPLSMKIIIDNLKGGEASCFGDCTEPTTVRDRLTCQTTAQH